MNTKAILLRMGLLVLIGCFAKPISYAVITVSSAIGYQIGVSYVENMKAAERQRMPPLMYQAAPQR